MAANETTTVRLALSRAGRPSARKGGGAATSTSHMNYGGHYRNTPAYLAFQAKAEGLHLVENLVVNKEQRIPDIDAFRTTPDPVSSRAVPRSCTARSSTPASGVIRRCWG